MAALCIDGSPSQAEILKAMSAPAFYPHAVDTIEQRDTIISKVFLTGHFAYKIKKPVNLEYLDFTTLAKRRLFCEHEVILNRRLAPEVYPAVVPITFVKGQYHLAGRGAPVEYTVKMRQLPENLSVRSLMRRGKLSPESIDELAPKLAGFYRQGVVNGKIRKLGARQSACADAEENFRQAEPLVTEIICNIVRN